MAENFDGHTERECGEHRTVGPHRVWCFDCSWPVTAFTWNVGVAPLSVRKLVPEAARAWTAIDERFTALLGGAVDENSEPEIAEALHTLSTFIQTVEAGL